MKQNKVPKVEYHKGEPSDKKPSPYRYDRIVDETVVNDSMGYWNPDNFGKIVQFSAPDGRVSMNNVNFPVIAISNKGEYNMQMPGQEYQYKGDFITEYPMAKNGGWLDSLPMAKNGGGLLNKTLTCPKCGWSWKAVDGGTDITTCHKCGGTAKLAYGGDPSLPNIEGHYQDGGAQTPEEWEKQIRAVENKIGDPSTWTLDSYKTLQDKLNEYKAWRENTEKGKAVVDYHNEPNEYVVPLPDHLKDPNMNYEKDLISKVLMNRNRDKDFVKRAYDVGAYPDSNMFTGLDTEDFGNRMSHKMSWGEDDSGQAYMYPNIYNTNNEAIKVPNQYADYISSEGYKKATGMIPERPFGGQNTKTHTHMKEGGWLDQYQTKGEVKPYKAKSQEDYDYRKKMYNDSLALHNYSDFQAANELDQKSVLDHIVDIGFGFLPVHKGERDYSQRVFNYAKNLVKNNPRIKIGLPGVGQKLYTEEDYKKEGSTDVYHDTIKPASLWMGDAVNAFYKKPVQQILPYTEEVIIKPSMTKDKSDRPVDVIGQTSKNKARHLMTGKDWQDVNSNDYGAEEAKIRSADPEKFDIYRLPNNKFELVPKTKKQAQIVKPKEVITSDYLPMIQTGMPEMAFREPEIIASPTPRPSSTNNRISWRMDPETRKMVPVYLEGKTQKVKEGKRLYNKNIPSSTAAIPADFVPQFEPDENKNVVSKQMGGWLDEYQDAGQLRAASSTGATPVSTQAPINPTNATNLDWVAEKWKNRDQGPSDWNFAMMDKSGSYVDSGVDPFSLMLPVQAISGAKAAAAANKGTKALSSKAGKYLTTKTPLKNTYKINPFALKENPEMYLYRARPVGQNPNMNMAAQLRAKEAAGKPLTWFQKNLLNPQTNPQMLAREKYYGQWFEKDPSRLDWYIDPGRRNFADDDIIEILRTRLPKSEAAKLNVSQFDDAKILSSSPETEFILPKDMVNTAETFPIGSWQELIQQDKAFNTPHWLRGYKKLGGWLDAYDDEYRRGGQRRKRGTSKNIKSSINDLFRRNYDVYGPAGKNRYDPTAYKTGGWLDNID